VSNTTKTGLFFLKLMKLEELDEMPPVMRQRAIWARQTILDHPELAEIDLDELLAWVKNEEDDTWYSIAGNYSQFSPAEKMEKRAKLRAAKAEREQRLAETGEMNAARQEYWSAVRQRIFTRDDHTCQNCGKRGDTKFHIHHIWKRNEGGGDADDNLMTLCPSCHPVADKSLYNPKWE
jgi:hypothetical protein